MSETDDDNKENEALFPQDWKNAITYLKSTWEAMAPPVPEQDLQGQRQDQQSITTCVEKAHYTSAD